MNKYQLVIHFKGPSRRQVVNTYLDLAHLLADRKIWRKAGIITSIRRA